MRGQMEHMAILDEVNFFPTERTIVTALASDIINGLRMTVAKTAYSMLLTNGHPARQRALTDTKSYLRRVQKAIGAAQQPLDCTMYATFHPKHITISQQPTGPIAFELIVIKGKFRECKALHT